MHVVLLPLGTRGDVQPMLAVGLALQARGHRVRVLTSPDFGSWIQGLGLEFTAVGESAAELIAANADGIDSPRRFVQLLCTSLDTHFAELPALAAGADLIVASGIQLAGPTVADKLGIPFRYLLFCPAIVASRHHPPVFMRWMGAPGWLNSGLWWLAKRVISPPVARYISAWRVKLGLPALTSLEFQDYIVGQGAILAADPDLAPLPDDLTFPCIQTGFLVLPGSGEPGLPADVEAFLQAGPPPVYVGFGSMPSLDAARWTQAIVAGVRGAGMRAILAGGWAGLGADAVRGEKPWPDSILRVGPVSHEALLPRVSAAVHHGGAGTTSTVARAGVPQILVPHGVDQYYWAHRVRTLGLGPAGLKHKDFGAETLARALGSLDDTMRARALEQGERMRNRAGLEATVAALESLDASDRVPIC